MLLKNDKNRELDTGHCVAVLYCTVLCSLLGPDKYCFNAFNTRSLEWLLASELVDVCFVLCHSDKNKKLPASEKWPQSCVEDK